MKIEDLLPVKKIVMNSQQDISGLSGTSRLHNHFISIERMTPDEFKNEGRNLFVSYSFSQSPFGKLLVASTSKGICHMAFEDEPHLAEIHLKSRFPNALFNRQSSPMQLDVFCIFQHETTNLSKIKLHLKGTDFQLKVWESLLEIPLGKLTTYGNIAAQIGNPAASRAVGTAIGSNPVAYLIPCHRVIQSSGKLGGYMWGETRKAAIIGWEQAKINQPQIQLQLRI